jgi:hypothetical protein
MGDIKISAQPSLYGELPAGERKKSELSARRREKGHCGIMVMQPACVISLRLECPAWEKRSAARRYIYCIMLGLFCVHLLPRAILLRALVEALKSNYTCLIAATIAQLVTTGSAFLK